MAAAAIAGKDTVKAGLQFSRVDEVVVNDLVSRWVREVRICSPHCAMKGTKCRCIKNIGSCIGMELEKVDEDVDESDEGE